jgi:hypothetical protein
LRENNVGENGVVMEIETTGKKRRADN